MQQDENIIVRCPRSLKEEVRDYAKAMDMSMGQVVRKALKEFFARSRGDVDRQK